jgi:glycosyltransferase involved in cell wall biosynthesis
MRSSTIPEVPMSRACQAACSRADLPLVSVITVTRDREETLLRCAGSVVAQDYLGQIEHLIVVDDRQLGQRTADRLRAINNEVRIEEIRTSDSQADFQTFFSVSRIGYLRNRGIDLCHGTYVAYLDDDNTFLPNHISSLVRLLEESKDAAIAYSWRYLLGADGEPYREPRYPWAPWSRLATDNERFACHIHEELLRTGIRRPDDHVQRDAVIASDGSPVFTVDTSELLVRRELHSSQRWVTRFTWREMAGDYSDDYAFVKRCHEAGVRFVCSEQATVNYYLNGVSNRTRTTPSPEVLPPLAERMRASYVHVHGSEAWRPELVRHLVASDGTRYRLFRNRRRHEYNRSSQARTHDGPCALCAEQPCGIVFLDRVLVVPDPTPFASGHFLLRFLSGTPEPRSLFESRRVAPSEHAHREDLTATDIVGGLMLAQATGDLVCFSMRGSGASFPEHVHAHAFRRGLPGSLTLPLLAPSAVRLLRDADEVRLSRTTTPAFGALLQGKPDALAERLVRTADALRAPVNIVAGCGAPFGGTWLLSFWRGKECPSHPLFRDEETGWWRFGFAEMLGLFEVKSLRQLEELTPTILEDAMRETTITDRALQADVEEALLC